MSNIEPQNHKIALLHSIFPIQDSAVLLDFGIRKNFPSGRVSYWSRGCNYLALFNRSNQFDLGLDLQGLQPFFKKPVLLGI